MEAIKEFFFGFIAVMKTFGFKDLIDILAVAFIIYSLNKLIRETRAVQLVKGLAVLLLIYGIAFVFDFVMLGSLLRNFFEFSVIVIFIVFQPEIRRLLEQIGRSKISGKTLKMVALDRDPDNDRAVRRKLLNSVLDATTLFSHSKTGALIVFEGQTKLGEIIDTGTVINAVPSVALVGNIFFNKAPLHDGAMIVRDNMIYAAGCVLPLTGDHDLEGSLGTRHRAAVGITEISDAVALVVSEETGTISIAHNGVLTRDYNRDSLRSRLEELLFSSEQGDDDKKRRLPFFRREKKNEQ